MRYARAAKAALPGDAKSCMTAVFIDTSIVVYAYANDPLKSSGADAIVSATPVLRSQVISGFAS